MHYFFLSAAFFAFHLLLAYLVDHVDIHAAFAIASATSVGLVVSYLRLVCGIRRALLYAGGAQLVFLVIFSYAFFFEGYTGLTIAVGAVVTLFLLMQLTGRVDWSRVFGRGALESGR
jgi:inner membrane protein involved in colicin E2 resistance